MLRGQLSEMQRDKAWEGKDLAERKAMTAHNLNMGGEENAQAAGLIATGDGAVREAVNGQSRRDEERRRRDQFTDAAIRAAQRIAEIDRQLAGLYDERDEIRDDIRETAGRIRILDGALARLQAGEELEQAEDGSLRDRDIEDQIRAYERRTGRQIDRADPDILVMVIQSQRGFEGGEMDHHRDRERDNQTEIDRLETLREHEVQTIQREHPDADVEELVAEFAARDDAVSWEAISTEGAPEELQVAAITNHSGSHTERPSEDFDLFGASDDELEAYEAFADEVDPEGAAQSQEPDEPHSEASVSPVEQNDLISNNSGPSGMGG